MRTLLLAALLAAGSCYASDYVAKIDKDNSIRLTEEPCPVEVIQHIPQGSRGFFQRAYAVLNGKQWAACWATRTDGNVLMVYSDGDQGLVPLGAFKMENGV